MKHEYEVKIRLTAVDDEFLDVLARRMDMKKAELARILIAQALKRVSMPPILTDATGKGRPA